MFDNVGKGWAIGKDWEIFVYLTGEFYFSKFTTLDWLRISKETKTGSGIFERVKLIFLKVLAGVRE